MSIVLKKKKINVKSVPNSEHAKAAMKAHIVKDQKAKALQEQSYLKTRDDIKGFWRQYPKAKALFGQIIVTGRRSTARRPGVDGYWAAYPYPWWSEKTKLPVATLKRHLNLLVEYGLIERQLGRHGGTRVLAFIRPTALALDLSDTRPGDMQHFGLGPKKASKTKPAMVAKVLPKTQPDDEKPMTFAEMTAILNN